MIPSRKANIPAIVLAAAGIISLLVQWYRTRPLWVDEEMIALNVRDRPLMELGGALWLNQSAPLGWLALQHWIVGEWGTAERALRALPVLFGIATLVVGAWAGRRWMRPFSVAVFLLLCMTGPFLSYFPLEMKQYSADIFCGLMFPVLTLWALDDVASPAMQRRRIHIWWGVATVLQWFSVTSLFLAPGCAAILCAASWARGSWKNAVRTAMPGVLFLASFGILYWVSLRYTLESTYLRNYWQMAYPPREAGIADTVRWLASRLKPLAMNPVGTRHWLEFWLMSCIGYYIVSRKDLWSGLVLLTAPLSAFALAGLGFVPMAERLSLWIVPALYILLAAAVGETAALARRLWSGKMRIAAIAAAVSFLAATHVAADIIQSGVSELIIQPRTKHGFDDRAAVRYLVQMHQPGDVLISSHLGLPALWWYAGVSVAAPNLGRAYRGSSIVRVGFRSGDECAAGEVPATLDGPKRALVYLGFDSNNPAGLRELVLDTLSRHGRISAYRAIGEQGIVAAFDLTREPAPWSATIAGERGRELPDTPRPSGCLGFFPEPRW